jgi:hypothetical protein
MKCGKRMSRGRGIVTVKGFPIFNEKVELGDSNVINTLFYIYIYIYIMVYIMLHHRKCK